MQAPGICRRGVRLKRQTAVGRALLVNILAGNQVLKVNADQCLNSITLGIQTKSLSRIIVGSIRSLIFAAVRQIDPRKTGLEVNSNQACQAGDIEAAISRKPMLFDRFHADPQAVCAFARRQAVGSQSRNFLLTRRQSFKNPAGQIPSFAPTCEFIPIRIQSRCHNYT